MSSYRGFVIKQIGQSLALILAKSLLVGRLGFDIFDYFMITKAIYSVFSYTPPVTKIVNITLLPPLPDHRYVTACTDETVNGLKGIIAKRLKGAGKNSLALIHNGYELVENMKLSEIFKEDEVYISVKSINPKGNYIKAPEPESSSISISSQ